MKFNMEKEGAGNGMYLRHDQINRRVALFYFKTKGKMVVWKTADMGKKEDT